MLRLKTHEVTLAELNHIIFSYFRSSSKTRKSDVGSDAEFAMKIQANLARLRNDENFCDLELFSGDCVEKNAALRAHR